MIGGCVTDYDQRREDAIRRLNDKRDFRTHLTVYLVVNAMLVAIWAFTGADFFWPIFPIAGWGVGLILHWYNVFMVRPPSEEQIQREIERGG